MLNYLIWLAGCARRVLSLVLLHHLVVVHFHPLIFDCHQEEPYRILTEATWWFCLYPPLADIMTIIIHISFNVRIFCCFRAMVFVVFDLFFFLERTWKFLQRSYFTHIITAPSLSLHPMHCPSHGEHKFLYPPLNVQCDVLISNSTETAWMR